MIFHTFRPFSFLSNYDIIQLMPNKKSYYPTANLRKRMKRRMLKHPGCTLDEYSGIEYCKDCPTLDELKAALVASKQSTRGILKLAALADNLSAYLSPRDEFDEVNYSDRTPGIRQYLEKDPLLKSKYKTIMRYKRLGDAIRGVAGIDLEVNLLWGLPDYAPKDEDEAMFIEFHCEDIQKLKNLYASCEGMNFKQIKERMK